MFDHLTKNIPGLQQIKREAPLFQNARMRFPVSLEHKKSALKKIFGKEIALAANHLVTAGDTTYKYYVCSETANNQKPWYATTDTKHPIVLVYIKKEAGGSKPVYYWIEKNVERTPWTWSETEQKYRLNFQWDWNEATYVAGDAQMEKAKAGISIKGEGEV